MHLVGFITKKFVTMHCHMKVKNYYITFTTTAAAVQDCPCMAH